MNSNIVEAMFSGDEQVRKYYSGRAGNYDAGTNFEIDHHAEAMLVRAKCKIEQAGLTERAPGFNQYEQARR